MKISAAELGEVAAKEAIKRAGLNPDQVDESIFGSARQAGVGPNLARQIAWRVKMPLEKTAFTVNKACGSGMKAITLGAQSIMLGEKIPQQVADETQVVKERELARKRKYMSIGKE